MIIGSAIRGYMGKVSLAAVVVSLAVGCGAEESAPEPSFGEIAAPTLIAESFDTSGWTFKASGKRLKIYTTFSSAPVLDNDGYLNADGVQAAIAVCNLATNILDEYGELAYDDIEVYGEGEEQFVATTTAGGGIECFELVTFS